MYPAFLARSFKNTELNLLAFTFFLFVFGTSFLFIISESIQQGLSKTAATVLGGDKVLVSPVPIAESIIQQAREQKLAFAETVSFLSMVFKEGAEENFNLADIKAIDASYPLYGKVL